MSFFLESIFIALSKASYRYELTKRNCSRSMFVSTISGMQNHLRPKVEFVCFALKIVCFVHLVSWSTIYLYGHNMIGALICLHKSAERWINHLVSMWSTFTRQMIGPSLEHCFNHDRWESNVSFYRHSLVSYPRYYPRATDCWRHRVWLLSRRRTSEFASTFWRRGKTRNERIRYRFPFCGSCNFRGTNFPRILGLEKRRGLLTVYRSKLHILWPFLQTYDLLLADV